MDVKRVISKDGSPTLYVPELNEHYHSIFGALQESYHVFINEGLRRLYKKQIHILEIGFGTGLNAALTYEYALKNKINIYYETVEKYPLGNDITSDLKFPEISNEVFNKLHEVDWEENIKLSDFFTIKKLCTDLKYYQPTSDFDLIYFDAFAPDKQAELWTEEIFSVLYDHTNINGILVTYTAKGTVKRVLRKVGYNVKRLEGPPGKRHMIRSEKL